MSLHRIAFELNGDQVACEVPPERLLVDLLRDELHRTGTKVGCGIGVCGACSVLVDGRVMTGCLLPAVFVDGRTVTTVEGLAPAEGELSPLQDAFVRHGGFQCGICTPGQLIAATALLAEIPSPSREEIREWMMGNLCRCTGYVGIIASIEAAVRGNEAANV
ncbi:MAG TPA: (2Fe-2S)-binding protein [Candidatus Acidoferrum sp.]|nr:(2Fe-2S)-binding protein [Candidatus Acidoferrum sp.]